VALSPRVLWPAGFALAVAIGIAGTAYVFRSAKTWAITVCQGDARGGCGSAVEHWIDCQTNPVNWAKALHPDACINVTVKKLADVPGGKCGFATLAIQCSSR
jgi:hypothetical protein